MSEANGQWLAVCQCGFVHDERDPCNVDLSDVTCPSCGRVGEFEIVWREAAT